LKIDYAKVFAPMQHEVIRFGLSMIVILAVSLMLGWIISRVFPHTVKRVAWKWLSGVLLLLGMYYYLTHITSFLGP
jgi:putative Mn2+ efflux pump MntP